MQEITRDRPAGSTNCTPHTKARIAGAMPKLITSASESISRPKSLMVCVMRAMRPSNPSATTATPMAVGGNFEVAVRSEAALARRDGALKRPDDGEKSKENVSSREERGQRVSRAARPAAGALWSHEALFQRQICHSITFSWPARTFRRRRAFLFGPQFPIRARRRRPRENRT